MNKLVLAFLPLVLLALSYSIFATAQAPDKIIYEGKEYMMHSNPMESYFQKFPEKKPKSGMISSGLWRGYIATFEIKDNQLLLKDIQIMVNTSTKEKGFEEGWKSVLNEVTPDGKPLKIDWFTGLLVLPHGKMMQYVHMGYASTYENYILLQINAGDFKKAKSFDHKEYPAFRERQFQEFKKTEEYKKMFDDLRKGGKSSPDFIESFLRIYSTNYTSTDLLN